jgi:AraC-like DNA-binding protein
MVLINPPAAPMGQEHVILWGRGRREYYVADFPGPLSVKSVVRGEAEWRTSEGRFLVDRESILILNRGQRYSITVEPGRGDVETFCVFFRDGFVERAWQPIEHALEHRSTGGEGFFERLHPKQGVVSELLSRTHAGMRGGAEAGWIEDRVFDLAGALSGLHGSVESERRQVPALKRSTREEIYRRLHRGRQAIESRTDAPIRLGEAAREACLSEFHFQRLFKQVFRESPHEYSLRLRLQRAARLLTETRLPVTDICLETGFRSPASFSLLFRKRFGAAPREIRKNR